MRPAHKDDSSGEYLLKDYVGECTAKYGSLDVRTLEGQRVYGSFLRLLGCLKEAKGILMAAHQGSRKALGSKHGLTLACEGDLALVLFEQGQLDDAEKLLVAMLKTERAMLGPTHQSTLATMGNLASVMKEQGKLEEAKPLMLEVLEGRRAGAPRRALRTLTHLPA